MSKINFLNFDYIMNLKDKENQTPALLFLSTNRGGGKTYGMGSWILKNMVFQTKPKQFALIARFKDEIGFTVDGFFTQVITDKYPNYEIEEHIIANGLYSEILLRQKGEESSEVIGYVLPLNVADRLKKHAYVLNKIDIMFMDEYQTEKYCKDEVAKLIRLRTTIARGGKNAIRFVRVVLCSNSLSRDNPYFRQLHMTGKVQDDTKIYKEKGLVYARFVVKDVANLQKADPFNQLFMDTKEMKSNIDNEYSQDNMAGTTKPVAEWGNCYYMATFVDQDVQYAIKKYNNLIYIDDVIDHTCNNIFTLSVDGTPDMSIVKKTVVYDVLRDYFFKGKLRYKNLNIKNDVLKWI